MQKSISRATPFLNLSMIDYQRWPIPIPPQFRKIEYQASRIPGLVDQPDLSLGANCQLYAYELLLFFGLKIPRFRSSELWTDTQYTRKVNDSFQPLDIMMYHRKPQAFGAHVAIYWGNGLVLHLSKDNGIPKIEKHELLLQQEKYTNFIGAKRVITI